MSDLGYTVRVLRQIGLLKAQNPIGLAKAGKAMRTWGPGFPAAVTAAAARRPKQIAVIDDETQLTWEELFAEINRTAHAFQTLGVVPGDSVALLCRNHRHMVIAMVALMMIGGRVLLLNTMASSAQLAELSEREGAKHVVLDTEFLDAAGPVPREKLIVAWADDTTPDDLPTLAGLARGASAEAHQPPERHGSVVIFTSGTTGLPKGAKREEPKDLKPLLAFFGSIPFKAHRTIVLAAPIFHSWGLVNFGFGLSTVPTYVLRRRFDPEQVLADIEQYRAEILTVVPVMMQRLVSLPQATIAKYDVSSLKITDASGAALPGELATTFMDTFTDSVYNFYGATETGWITIANPEDLRAAPGTAGRAPWRTTVKILDADGQPVPQGETGIIHVVNDMPFGGYTDGRTKDFRDDLMSSGDLGYFDADGRLFVSGRDDDMVIVGGENVFPRELEDALVDHPKVQDVVVQGVPDPDWGQSLAAYLVLRDGEEFAEDAVIAYAKQTVARFAVPRHVVYLSELPRNPTGKVMKRDLPALS